MSIPPGHEPRPGRAAVPAEPPKKKRPGWLLPLIAALVVLALLLLLLSQCGGDDEDTATGTDPAPAATASPAPSPTAPDPSATLDTPVVPSPTDPSTTDPSTTDPSPTDPGANAPQLPQAGPSDTLVTASGVALLPLAADGGADLTAVVDQPVTADGVQVQSVVTDQGFWVGPDTNQRVFVLFDVQGESDVTIEAGQVIDFTGTVVPTPDGLADQIGLTQDEGAALLQAQGVHLLVVPSDVVVVDQAG
ncbi:hypothetical protein [uncultured Pseudokineococcus sp.]|uniref:hypothetical protein n=1 Tax=uncultured Pseudokineococcus sp. TaxID=1642928 RepID=UPI00261E3815|nr:hypothetical protein [uncultured Pseudokineococcus sp.]